MGRATVSEIQAEFEQLIRRGELVEVEQTAGRPGRACTTPAMIALEQRTMALMREGQRTQPPLIHASTQAAVARAYAGLSADQARGRGRDLRNRDRVQALEGVAGAGKTTTLAAVRDAAEREGYVVKGLAPTVGRRTNSLKPGCRRPRCNGTWSSRRPPRDGAACTCSMNRVSPAPSRCTAS